MVAHVIGASPRYKQLLTEREEDNVDGGLGKSEWPRELGSGQGDTKGEVRHAKWTQPLLHKNHAPEP